MLCPLKLSETSNETQTFFYESDCPLQVHFRGYKQLGVPSGGAVFFLYFLMIFHIVTHSLLQSVVANMQ